MDIPLGFEPKLDADTFRRNLDEAETRIDGNQPLFVFDNHDNPRTAARYGDGVHNQAIDKMLATILFTTRSTVLMYYGDEIEMPTTEPTSKDQVKDPIGITGWPKEKGRDGERTPMQWNSSVSAGFSSNPHTWLPVAPDYRTVNVEKELKHPDSMLNWYKKLIALRRSNPAIRAGTMAMLVSGNPQVLSWSRTSPGGKVVIVACNFDADPQVVSLRSSVGGSHKTAIVLAASGGQQKKSVDLNAISLPPYGSIVAEVK
jgi:alpha-glucosidase